MSLPSRKTLLGLALAVIGVFALLKMDAFVQVQFGIKAGGHVMQGGIGIGKQTPQPPQMEIVIPRRG